MCKQFLDAVEQHTTGLEAISGGILAACDDCQRDYGYDDVSQMENDIESGKLPSEPSFSWRDCETCGQIAGDRYDGHGLDANGELVHLSMCADCLCWFANGDLPDQYEG